MDILQLGKNRVTVELCLSECIALNNALNEVCNALDIQEFTTRMGVDYQEIENLLRQFHVLIERMQASPN